MRISNFTTAILFFIFSATIVHAAPPQTTYHIKVDQFAILLHQEK
jgi:hypothetical protein